MRLRERLAEALVAPSTDVPPATPNPTMPPVLMKSGPFVTRPNGSSSTPRLVERAALTILLVEDNPGDALLVREALPAKSYEVIDVSSLAGAAACVEANSVDAVLLDLSLPDGGHAETIAWARATAKHTPVVVLTGLDDDRIAMQTLRAGAQDYLEKDRINDELLRRTIHYSIERQRLQQDLEELRQRQLEAKDRLLANVSHELRTPLHAVQECVALVLDEIGGPVTPEQQRYLGIAQRNAEQLRTMIADLLDATRLDCGSLSIEPLPTSVREIVHAACEAFTPERTRHLRTEVAPDVSAVLADPRRVRQVITNLLQNAFNFTPEDGAISLRAVSDPEQPCFVRVSVADTGRGIGPDALERIFQRFEQGDDASVIARTGLGLGLHICRELVTRQGGRIWVESRLGEGSCFHFTLPVAPA